MSGQAYHSPGASAREGSTVLLLACCLALPGCGRGRPVAPEVPAEPWEGKPTRVLEQDVGRVRHGQKVRRRFAITNDSGGKWTLARLHNGCACTAGRPLTDEVLPGKALEVDVDYIAAPRSFDDRRRVGVEFLLDTGEKSESEGMRLLRNRMGVS